MGNRAPPPGAAKQVRLHLACSPLRVGCRPRVALWWPVSRTWKPADIGPKHSHHHLAPGQGDGATPDLRRGRLLATAFLLLCSLVPHAWGLAILPIDGVYWSREGSGGAQAVLAPNTAVQGELLASITAANPEACSAACRAFANCTVFQFCNERVSTAFGLAWSQ